MNRIFLWIAAGLGWCTGLALAVEYTLQQDDTIRMSIYQEESLSTEAQIGKQGNISFPLIGSVKVEGLTVAEAEDLIKAAYEKDYLVSAGVNLTVVGYARQWVIVGGDVRSPGTVTIPEDGALDLGGAIVQAGGLLESADQSRVSVRRRDAGTTTYNLKSSSPPILKHGDTITVARSSLANSSLTVTGQVGSPGVIELPKEGRLDILTTIAKAGGFSQIANRKTVTVRRGDRRILVNLRAIEKGEAELFYMQPGDILTIAESIF